MKATLLTEKETYGENKLDIIEKYGTKAKASDFAIATGVWVPDSEEKTGWYWLKTPYKGCARAVDHGGDLNSDNTAIRYVGVRPVLEFSSIDEIINLGGEIIGDNLRLGYYTDKALTEFEQRKWDKLFFSGKLIECGKYPLDSVKYDDCYTHYNPIKVSTYEHNGKKATNLKVNSSYDGKYFELSNGEKYKDGDYVWIEVKEKDWYWDEKNLKAISKDICLGGLQFDNESCNYEDEKDFPNTNLGKYLENVFLPELLQFNQSIDYNNEKINNHELLEKIKIQQQYIKELEQKNLEYKKFIARANNKIEEIIKRMSDAYSDSDNAKLTKTYTNR